MADSSRPFRKMPRGSRILRLANTIYVNNRDRNGKPVSGREFKRRVKEVEKMLLGMFGGYTTGYVERGEFISRNNKPIRENVVRVTSFADRRSFLAQRKRLEKWLVSKKKEWNQETVAYEFEGDLFYI